MSRRGITTQTASSIPIDDTDLPYTADTVQEAMVETANVANDALNLPIFTIVLQHNGTVSNGTVIGYDSLIPGDDTPIVVFKKAEFVGFTFSNNKSSADYTLQFRKNSLANSPFYTISKVNTQYFTQVLPTPELFQAGDLIFVTYIENGTNASDVVVVLNYKTVP